MLFTLFASAGLILSPFAAGCGAAAKVNGIVAGVAAAVLGALGIRSPSAQRALRSLAVGLCLAALLMPRALAPWSYDVFAISIFATSFVGG